VASGRKALFALAAVGLAAVMFLTGAVTNRQGDVQSATPQGRGPAGLSVVSTTGDLSGTIAALQARLQRVPTDSTAWASLGLAYVQQTRITGDPSYFAKADGVLDRSLEVKPEDNAPALAGMAALAAARHDFAGALRLARQAHALNEYNSVSQGMLVDALVELGRYPQAYRAVEQMVELKPSVPSYTRVSYAFELQGNLDGARYAMQRALETAYSADDKAFALLQLGELAWNSGDLAGAERHYTAGLELAPSFVPLLAGQAKVEAASGDTAAALRDYAIVTQQLPQLTYVIEYAQLLSSLGRDAAAERQYVVVEAQQRLLRSAGVDLDLDLALYDADRGRVEESLSAARNAWEARRSVQVEDAYAWALHVNGRDRAAIVHARAAVAQGTRSALFAYHRGMVELSLGMRDEAQRSLRRALSINPHFSVLHAPIARRALASLRAGA